MNFEGVDDDIASLVTDGINTADELLIGVTNRELYRAQQKIVSDIEKDLDAYNRKMTNLILRLQLIVSLEVGVHQRIMESRLAADVLDKVIEKFHQRLDDLTEICNRHIMKQCDFEIMSKDTFSKLKDNRDLFERIHQDAEKGLATVNKADLEDIVKMLSTTKSKMDKMAKDYEVLCGFKGSSLDSCAAHVHGLINDKMDL
jgi:phosphate uptake regulator